MTSTHERSDACMRSPRAPSPVGRSLRLAAAPVALAVVLATSGCSGDDSDPVGDPTDSPATSDASPGALPSAQPAPSNRPTTNVAAGVARAGARQSARFATASVVVLARNNGSAEQTARSVAGGQALRDLLSAAGEFADKGWYTTGQPKVVGEPQVTRSKRAGTIRVTACVDNSKVVVHAKDGSKVATPDAQERTLNVFRMKERDGRWLVVGQTLPANPAC